MDASNDVDREGGPSLLVVDDNELIRSLLAKALQAEGFARIETAASAAQAREQLATRCYDIVITDLSMPDGDGIELMQWAGDHHPGASWMVLTGHASLDAAVRALQLGAFDFITKPLEGLAGLRNTVRNALAHRRLLAERDHLLAALSERNAQLADHVQRLESACALLDEDAEATRTDLRRAAYIQQALLPRMAPVLEKHRVHAVYRPSQHVAGDLYDLVRVGDHQLFAVIADAAGHGLSAAMLAVLFHQQLPLEPGAGMATPGPAALLAAVNRSLTAGLTAPGLFVTAACCLLDLRSGSLQIASAGHPPVLVQRRDGRIERFLHTGPALGLYSEAQFAEHDAKLASGERLLLHTDGFHPMLGESAAVAESQLAAKLGALRDGPALIDDLLRHLDGSEAADGERRDDCTLVLLEALPGVSSLDNGALPSPPLRIASASPARNDLLVGSAGERLVLCIRGRGDWRESAAFHSACCASIDAGRPVTLDLTLCEHLDSTFLGTLHELAERAENAQVELRVQGVMPPVERLFLELGMRSVLERSVATLLPLPPDMQPLADRAPDASARGQRVLDAHARLAGLNRRNAREFDPLLEQLRREMALASNAPGR